jgi:hypothetical protein
MSWSRRLDFNHNNMLRFNKRLQVGKKGIALFVSNGQIFKILIILRCKYTDTLCMCY